MHHSHCRSGHTLWLYQTPKFLTFRAFRGSHWRDLRFPVLQAASQEGIMGRAIEVRRLELSARELRQRASRCGDGRVACRVLAIAHVLEGASRAAAASACGMDRQTLRDWVHRYNGDGIAGLSDAP